MSPCSSVSQGLQSCFEIEAPLEKMRQSSTKFQEYFSAKTWDFNFTQSPTNETEHVYVHPLVKRSASSLSTRSLEMCTESLGSETGSVFDSTNIGQDLSYNNNVSMERQSKQAKTRVELGKKVKSFPPPLSSIDGVQVQTHREGGRLVIKAFSVSSCFQAERDNGRLRLSLMKDTGYENEDEADEVKEENGIGVEKNCEDKEEDDLNGRFWGENLRDGGIINGGEWSRWCNGDRSSGETTRLRSLPFCVAIS